MAHRRPFLLSLAVLALGASACDAPTPPPGQDVLMGFATGAPRPDVLVALPVGPGIGDADRMVVGYERDRYMIAGQGVEVIWVRRATDAALADLDRADVNPVVFREDQLDGWGWDHFDRRAAEWGLRDRLVAAEADRPDWAPDSGVEADSADEARGRRPRID
jgi:hypothetical protein